MARDKAKMVPVKTPGNAWGSTCSLTTLPAGRPQGKRGLPNAVGYSPQGFTGSHNDNGQHQQRQG